MFTSAEDVGSGTGDIVGVGEGIGADVGVGKAAGVTVGARVGEGVDSGEGVLVIAADSEGVGTGVVGGSRGEAGAGGLLACGVQRCSSRSDCLTHVIRLVGWLKRVISLSFFEGHDGAW